jgi:pilus assembly protein CpaB
LKRSNRLVLLIGVFLAIVAFVGIFMLMSDRGGEETLREPTELPTVVARADIPLGTPITAAQVTTETLAVEARDPGAFQDTSQVIGKIARQPVTSGQQITSATLSGGEQGQILDIQVPPGKRAMAVQVDQVTGVGTVIKTGDYVDMVLGFTGESFPVITINPTDDSLTLVSGVNGTTVKAVLQGLQVLGTLLPPADETTAENQEQGEDGEESGTTLTGQQQVVILAVDARQSEVLKFAELDGEVSLALRSPQDFIDPETKQVVTPIPDETDGVILKTLVDQYGVLPPEVIEAVIPESQ